MGIWGRCLGLQTQDCKESWWFVHISSQFVEIATKTHFWEGKNWLNFRAPFALCHAPGRDNKDLYGMYSIWIFITTWQTHRHWLWDWAITRFTKMQSRWPSQTTVCYTISWHKTGEDQNACATSSESVGWDLEIRVVQNDRQISKLLFKT